MYLDVEKLRQRPETIQCTVKHLDIPFLTVDHGKVPVLGPVIVSIETLASEDGVDVSGSVQANLKLHCGYCLEEFTYETKATFVERFVPKAKFDQMSDEEKQRTEMLYYEGKKIQLSQVIEQAIYLSLPMTIRCKEDCKGLCTVCGRNLNLEQCACEKDLLDPRLAVLQQLLK